MPVEDMDNDPAVVVLMPPSDKERANRNSLLFLSLMLLLVAMPVVVWHSFAQPLVLVWRLSLLLCCSCAISTGLLATSLPAQTVLLRLAFVFVLALCADAALDPKIGMLIIHLSSHLAVGMAGYAVAERRQHDGTEVSAATVRIPSKKKHADRVLRAQKVGVVFFAMITLGVAAGIAWVVCHGADFTTEVLVMCVFLPVSAVLFLWITFVGSMLLQGALIAETGFSALMAYMILMSWLYTYFALTMGDTWAMILVWPLMLGFSGLLGYCICVYSTFKLRMRLGLPPLKLNESKEDSSMEVLLEKQGRGSEDLHLGDAGVKPKVA